MMQRLAIPLLRRGLPSIATKSQASRLISTSRSSFSNIKNITVADPGYSGSPESRKQEPPAKDAVPSRDFDPFPLVGDPRLEGLSLSSKHQLENLSQDPKNDFPLRVPGREPGQESRKIKIARLKYQIRHRGILETDLILSTFAKSHLESMSDEDLDEFDVVSSWRLSFFCQGKRLTNVIHLLTAPRRTRLGHLLLDDKEKASAR